MNNRIERWRGPLYGIFKVTRPIFIFAFFFVPCWREPEKLIFGQVSSKPGSI